MGFCFATYKEKDMKLDPKTQNLNVISDDNLANLFRYAESTRLASDDDENASQEAVYQLGANHAFTDAIDMIEAKDVSKKTAVDGQLLTLVVLGIGAVVLYGPVKRRIKKLVDKRLASPAFKAHAAKVHDEMKNNGAS